MGRDISFNPGHAHYNWPAQGAQDHPESSVAGPSSAGPGELAAEAAVTGEQAAQWNANRSSLPATAPVAMSSLQFQLLHQMHAEAGPSTGLRPADMQTEAAFLAHDAAGHRGGELDDDLSYLLNDPRSDSRLAEMAAFVADSPSSAQMAPATEPPSGGTVFSLAKIIGAYKAALQKAGRSAGGVSIYVAGLKHIAKWLESEKEKGHEIPHGLDSLEKLGRHQNQDHVKEVLQSFKESDIAKAIPLSVKANIGLAFAAFQQALWPEIHHPPKSQLTPEEEQLIRAYMAIAQEEGSHKKRAPHTVLNDAVGLRHLAQWLRESAASVPDGLNSLEKLGRHQNQDHVKKALQSFNESDIAKAIPPSVRAKIRPAFAAFQQVLWPKIHHPPKSQLTPEEEQIIRAYMAIAQEEGSHKKRAPRTVLNDAARLKHLAQWLRESASVPYELNSLEKLGRHRNDQEVNEVLGSFTQNAAVPPRIKISISSIVGVLRGIWFGIEAKLAAGHRGGEPDDDLLHLLNDPRSESILAEMATFLVDSRPPAQMAPAAEPSSGTIDDYKAALRKIGRSPGVVSTYVTGLKHIATWLASEKAKGHEIPHGLDSLEKLGCHQNQDHVKKVLQSFKESNLAKVASPHVRANIGSAFAAFQQALWPEIHPPKMQLTPEEEQIIRAYMAIAQEEGSHQKRAPGTVLNDATHLKHLAHWLRKSASVPYGLNSLEKLGRHLNDQEVNEVLESFTQSPAVPSRIKKKMISSIVGVLRRIWLGIEANLEKGKQAATDLDTTDLELDQFAADLEVHLEADLDAALPPSETATGWADPAGSSLTQSGTTPPRLPAHSLGETPRVAQPSSQKRAAPELPAESRGVRARPTASSLPGAPRPPQTALQQRLLSQASRMGSPFLPAPSRRGTADEDEN